MLRTKDGLLAVHSANFEPITYPRAESLGVGPLYQTSQKAADRLAELDILGDIPFYHHDTDIINSSKPYTYFERESLRISINYLRSMLLTINEFPRIVQVIHRMGRDPNEVCSYTPDIVIPRELYRGKFTKADRLDYLRLRINPDAHAQHSPPLLRSTARMLVSGFNYREDFTTVPEYLEIMAITLNSILQPSNKGVGVQNTDELMLNDLSQVYSGHDMDLVRRALDAVLNYVVSIAPYVKEESREFTEDLVSNAVVILHNRTLVYGLSLEGYSNYEA